MTGFFYRVIESVVNFLGVGGIFFIAFLLNTGIFVTCLILSVKLVGYKIKKRLWVISGFLSVIILQYGLEGFVTNGKSLGVLSISISLLYMTILFLIKERKYKSSVKQRIALNKILSEDEFNKNPRDKKLDDMYSGKYYSLEKKPIEKASNSEKESCDKISNSTLYKDESIPPESIIKTAIMEGEERSKREELDFSHVRNIIKRLEYYPLKECDKKQVTNLEVALLRAEKGEFDKDVKASINDGLGALLKIMSKYGI